ncbi:Fe-S cluster assembly protein SufD [Candidatus Woesearchaeota archaeon]|nr:Fe-S cluster assembly protein SufD [Candidatus Woesearchaeota archaeon]
MLKSKEMSAESIIQKISKEGNEPEWLLKRRLGALKLFREAQMPLFTYGLNMNLSIDLDLDEVDANEAGKADKKIRNSNRNIIIENFHEALKNHGDILMENFMKAVPANEKFTYLHQAFLNNLTFVYAPKNIEVKEPIEISSGMDSNALFDHLIILAEDNSKLTLVEDSNSNAGNGYKSKIVEIYAKGNAIINYGDVQLLSHETFNFTIKRAVIGKNSRINWMDCCFGSKATMSEVTTILNGEGASTNNHGIFFGSKAQQFDLVANSLHKAPNTVSDIFTKGALTDKAKCVYRGLVKIYDNAYGSNGYQKEDTLLLSNDAVADSIPNLEIDNNDVRCTHGATIGRIDKEKMFYMRSRGLNEEQATKEYVKGFFDSLIQKIQMENLRDNMHDMVESIMSKK